MSQREDISKPALPPLERAAIQNAEAPRSARSTEQLKSDRREPETFGQLIMMIIQNGIKHLPDVILRVLIIIAIITAMNFIIMTIPTYSVRGASRTLLFFMVFMTASYNGVIQRTIFWSILLTVGKRLALQIKREGFKQVKEELSQILPCMKEIKERAGAKFIQLFLTGCGIGFILANYLTRNNRIDKQSVSILIAMTIIGSVIKRGNSLLILALRLFLKDVTRLSKEKSVLALISKVLLSGVSTGLMANLVFAVIKIDKGGYILGTLLLVVAVTLYFSKLKGDENH